MLLALLLCSCVTSSVLAVGTKTVCPVSQEVITVSSDTPHLEYEGKTYYFCCNDCPEEFKKTPQAFTKK
jgi:YHS domain-containing protein